MRYIDILLIEGTCPTSGKAETHRKNIPKLQDLVVLFGGG